MNYMNNASIPLYIVGLSKNEPSVVLIQSKFEGVIRRLKKVYSKIEEARITVKKLRTGGQKQCYEVSVLIITSNGNYTYSETGWDLSNICEKIGQKLLRNLSKHDNKRLKTSIRKTESKIF